MSTTVTEVILALCSNLCAAVLGYLLASGKAWLDLERLRAAVRRHRDWRGDDRCWLDDEVLYAALPEGYSPPARDTAVELANCARFIANRQNPVTEYVSPNVEIDRLRGIVNSLAARVAAQSALLSARAETASLRSANLSPTAPESTEVVVTPAGPPLHPQTEAEAHLPPVYDHLPVVTDGDESARRIYRLEQPAIIETCHSHKDGDCDWQDCPQQRDGEPGASGRHCPLDVEDQQ